jgi:hypothetical protein
MTDDQLNISLDTVITATANPYLTIDARGTLIKVPTDVIFKSSVIKALCQHKKPDEQFYLNFDPKHVHELVDFLSGYKSTVSQECSALMDYCGIEQLLDQIYITIDARGVEMKVLYSDFINYEPVKQFYSTHKLTEQFKIKSDVVQMSNFIKYIKNESYLITSEFLAICKEFGFQYKVRNFKPFKPIMYLCRVSLYPFQIDNTQHMIYVNNDYKMDLETYTFKYSNTYGYHGGKYSMPRDFATQQIDFKEIPKQRDVLNFLYTKFDVERYVALKN